jgi:hypothetical protein
MMCSGTLMTSTCLRQRSERFEREFPCSPLPNAASSRCPNRLPAAAVLMECRRLKHERTGQAIAAMFKQRIPDHVRQLAHHYSRRSCYETLRVKSLPGCPEDQRIRFRTTVQSDGDGNSAYSAPARWCR